MFKKIIGAVIIAAIAFGGTACATDADTVSENLSVDAEQFKVERRIVFINGITDKYLFTIEGRCSLETDDSFLGGALEVTCKLGPDEYKKSFLGLSDNVTYIVEQIEAVDADEYHYKVIFKPESILPTIDLETGVADSDD